MTLNNFEKRAKKFLSRREIVPKTEAWDKISTALKEEENTPKANYFWYGIAAGFIGLLIVSVIFFKPTTAVIQDNQIVVSPDNTTDTGRKKNDKSKGVPTANTPIKEEDVVIVRNSNEIKKEVVESPALASVIPTVEKELNKKVSPAYAEEIIDTKLEEVLAKVKLLEGDKNTISDAEVDSLLRQAQKELLTDRFMREDNSVDATALLSEVEDELDQSFRDQIFKKLKTGFDKVRTAVADRNN